MGWWETNEEGVSFAHSREGMVWGDGPADDVDNALHSIRQQYIAEWGRLPSRAEIIAGLTFSLRVFLEHLPERPAQESPLTEDEQLDYASAVHNLADHGRDSVSYDSFRQTIARTEAKFASEDDEADGETDAEFRERLPKLLSLMNEQTGLVFSTPGPEVGSEAENAAQTPPSEDPAITQLRKDMGDTGPHLKVVTAEHGKFDHVQHLLNRPVEAHYEGYGNTGDVTVRGLLRYREGEVSCTQLTSDPYLIVERFSGTSASGSSDMEMTALELDDLTPQELREWNLSAPVEFTRFVFENYMTKGW